MTQTKSYVYARRFAFVTFALGALVLAFLASLPSKAPIVERPIEVAPFTQQQRQEFAGQLLEVLDLSERVMALALASVHMTGRVNAVEQMRQARWRLVAVGDRIPKAPQSEHAAKELANKVDTVVAVRLAAAGYWLDYLDDGKPSQAADARQRGARAEQLAREAREQLQVWQPAAERSP